MRIVAALTAILIASAVSAQDRMTVEDCAAAWGRFALTAQFLPTATTVDQDGWCMTENVLVPMGDNTSLRAVALMWRASDIDRWIDEGLPPRAVDMRATGLGTLLTTGDANFDYLMDVQSQASDIDAALSVRWDGVQNVVFLDEATLTFSDRDTLEITAKIDGVNLTDMVSLQQSIGTFAVSNISIKAAFDGWFERFLLIPAGQTVLQYNDVPPQQQVAGLKAQAERFIVSIPDDVMPSPAREALIDFVGDLPSPRGAAQLQITSDPGIGLVDVFPLARVAEDPSVLAALANRVKAVMTWTPSGERP